MSVLDAQPIVRDERELFAADDMRMKVALGEVFPHEREIFLKQRGWNGSAPAYTAVIESAGRVIVYVGVIVRDVIAGGRRVSIAGVQNVGIVPEHRGKGLLDRTLDAAMREGERRKLDVGLLFCLPVLERVYARCGWKKVEPQPPIVRATRADGSEYAVKEKDTLMFAPLLASEFPGGDLDLKGDTW